MTAAIAFTAAVVVVAVVVRLVVGASRRRDRSDTSVEAWTDPTARSRPDALDLDLLGLSRPGEGALLGVVFTHPQCESCSPLAHRVAGIEALTTAVIDVTDAPGPVRAAGVTSVPTLVLVDQSGAVVRSWIGTPLAGTVEETVRRTLGA